LFIGRLNPRIEREDEVGGELGMEGKVRGERGQRVNLRRFIWPPAVD
jgi:hypothetical protein